MSEQPRMAETREAVIHILIAGQTACGTLRGVPANWPPGHLWVRKELGYRVNCPKCQSLLPEILAEGKR